MITTRFAPSPTGYFHAGSYRTALFSWIFAKQNSGKFILRIEDTDKQRSKKEYEDNIIESLKWLGLDYQEFFRQSDRTDIYKGYINKLIENGLAYVSNETKIEVHENNEAYKSKKSLDNTTIRSSVIRFKNPNKIVIFEDTIRGRVQFDTTELGDFIIAKSLEEPVFHLVVVVDDFEMGITHIIRGEDHISNTPRQILLYEAIGAKLPQYAHIPLLLSSDRSKLSKRKGAIPISEYRAKGYIREAIINYLVLLGWHPSNNIEILNIDEIIKEFSLERVQKSSAIFDEEKLRWFNRQYIIKMSDTDFSDYAKFFLPEWLLQNSILFAKLIPVLKDKITTFGEIQNMLSISGDLSFIKHFSEFPKELLFWKKESNTSMTQVHLSEIQNLLSQISVEDFNQLTIKETIWSYVESFGKGNVLWPLRTALTGQEKSPDPFLAAEILGRDESLDRLDKAINKLK